MIQAPLPPSESTVTSRRGRRHGGGVRLFLSLLLVLPLAACATKADIRDLGADIRSQNQAQAEQIEELLREQQLLNDSIRSLKAGQMDLRGTVLQRIAALQTEVGLLREITGMTQQELAALRDQAASRPAGQLGAGSQPDQTGEAAEIYGDALAQFHREGFAAARMGFESLVEEFPNHDLTPEARYYIGEILVEQGDPDEAIEAFLRIPEYHPSAERVPDALFRVGQLYHEQGDDATAREYLERLVNTWGETGAADLARELLREIG